MNRPPWLTDRARASEPAMMRKAREIIGSVAYPGSDKDALLDRLVDEDPDATQFSDCAWKALGTGVSPKIDASDDAFCQIYAALEAAGAFSPDEMATMERELPRMQGTVQRLFHLSPDRLDAMPPAMIRAYVFAQFANGREEEGTPGDNLHIGVRRAFERVYAMTSGLQGLANRMGFYRASDLFEPAYRSQAPRGRATMTELGPNEPGESVPIGRNKLKAQTS